MKTCNISNGSRRMGDAFWDFMSPAWVAFNVNLRRTSKAESQQPRFCKVFDLLNSAYGRLPSFEIQCGLHEAEDGEIGRALKWQGRAARRPNEGPLTKFQWRAPDKPKWWGKQARGLMPYAFSRTIRPTPRLSQFHPSHATASQLAGSWTFC